LLPSETPLIVLLARSVFVTNPVAVKLDVIVGLAIEGEEASTTLPVPVTPFSPNTPPLSYSMSPDVPLVIVVVPTARLVAAAVTVQGDPRVQVCPFTVVEEFSNPEFGIVVEYVNALPPFP
jgi:hypothetical protein